jgi:ankyrin repeat protein
MNDMEKLIHCVFVDDTTQLDELLQAGSDPNTHVVLESPPPILAFRPSLLAMAAFHSALHVFNLLMRRKANQKLSDSMHTPLECFIAAGGNVHIMKSFLQSSTFQARLPSKNALHFAAEYGHAKMVKFLLEVNYCSPNCVDANGVFFRLT